MRSCKRLSSLIRVALEPIRDVEGLIDRELWREVSHTPAKRVAIVRRSGNTKLEPISTDDARRQRRGVRRATGTRALDCRRRMARNVEAMTRDHRSRRRSGSRRRSRSSGCRSSRVSRECATSLNRCAKASTREASIVTPAAAGDRRSARADRGTQSNRHAGRTAAERGPSPSPHCRRARSAPLVVPSPRRCVTRRCR